MLFSVNLFLYQWLINFNINDVENFVFNSEKQKIYFDVVRHFRVINVSIAFLTFWILCITKTKQCLSICYVHIFLSLLPISLKYLYILDTMLFFVCEIMLILFCFLALSTTFIAHNWKVSVNSFCPFLFPSVSLSVPL